MNKKSDVATKVRPVYARKYNSWRIRILSSIIIGYATFYFCRQNFSIATPAILDHFNITKTQFGWILTASSVVYGIGKFCNGFISDRSNARIFMSSALLIVGIITFLLGFSKTITTLGILWIICNWFQSMGWPPATRMLTHWFASKELGTKWALGATSNQIGGAVAMLVCGYLVENYGWEAAFFIPGVTAILVSIFLFNRLRSSPEEVNLPQVEMYKECQVDSSNDYSHMLTGQLLKLVFCNRLIWYVCLANMFIYIVRIGIISWAPTFLYELRNMSIAKAGLQIAIYDILGIGGAIAAGWMSDKLFAGRRGPVGTISMLALTVTLILFWQIPTQNDLLASAMLATAGFFVAGPQMLVGVATADFSNRQAVGTANGLSGVFAYAGASLAGIGVGLIADNWGWSGVFLFFTLSAFLGACFFALTWNYSAKKIHN